MRGVLPKPCEKSGDAHLTKWERSGKEWEGVGRSGKEWERSGKEFDLSNRFPDLYHF
jgi:hypothetical protein